MIRPDLVLHFLAGFFIVTLLQFDWAFAILAVVIIGVGKEFYDKFVRKTMFDWKDLACTITGGFTGYWVWLVYK